MNRVGPPVEYLGDTNVNYAPGATAAPATTATAAQPATAAALANPALRVSINASSGRRGEGRVFPSSDLHIVNVKGDWLLGPREERFPGRHVGIQRSHPSFAHQLYPDTKAPSDDGGDLRGYGPPPLTSLVSLPSKSRQSCFLHRTTAA